MINKKILAVIALGVVTLTLTTAGACAPGKITEPFNDAPRSGIQNGNAADVVTFPDGFSNVSTKCDHGNRLYVAFHGDGQYASIVVVPGDPTCK